MSHNSTNLILFSFYILCTRVCAYVCMYISLIAMHFWLEQLSLPSETKAVQGSAFQKYCHFSTAVAGDACDEGSERNDT